MSKLDEISGEFRKKNLSKNAYNDSKNEYNVSNKNALSDGDDLGKGDLNGSVGSKSDINKRVELSSKNKYTLGSKEYNLSNY